MSGKSMAVSCKPRPNSEKMCTLKGTCRYAQDATKSLQDGRVWRDISTIIDASNQCRKSWKISRTQWDQFNWNWSSPYTHKARRCLARRLLICSMCQDWPRDSRRIVHSASNGLHQHTWLRITTAILMPSWWRNFMIKP